jgi:hypothetical protein
MTTKVLLWMCKTFRFAASSIGLVLALDVTAMAQPQTANIVGLGATSCERFNTDVAANPALGRDYLAWSQGFMSGILVSRPVGVDERLDLNPKTLGLRDQLQFLKQYCTENLRSDFSDAVAALYRRLRMESESQR